MRFGVTFFPTDYAISPAALGRALEERGFESLFVTEHTHIPVSRESEPYIPGSMNQDYWHTLDPFVALTAAATATTTLRIGTGICLVPQHHPINLAKQVASLDHLSGGRFVFGAGAGWNAEEMAGHGVAFKDRWKVTRERVLAMKAIWNEEEPEFHGEFVNFEKMWSWPKPVQPGGPPVLIGANSRWTFDRIAEYGDGWLCIDVGVPGFATPAEGKEALRVACEKRGRDASAMDITVVTFPSEEQITKLAEVGVSRILLGVPSAGADVVEPQLDQSARLREQFALA